MWEWIRKECLKRATEVLIRPAQEQVIRTNNIKAKMNETHKDSKCGMCEKLKRV